MPAFIFFFFQKLGCCTGEEGNGRDFALLENNGLAHQLRTPTCSSFARPEGAQRQGVSDHDGEGGQRLQQVGILRSSSATAAPSSPLVSDVSYAGVPTTVPSLLGGGGQQWFQGSSIRAVFRANSATYSGSWSHVRHQATFAPQP